MTGLFASRRWIVAALSAVVPFTAVAAPAPPAGLLRVQGPYVNTQYGFRFAAPSGRPIFRAPAPAPNHGALVVLGPVRRIDVSAAFDAPEYGSTAALMSARLPPNGAGSVRRTASTLGGRAAERATYARGSEAHVFVARHEGGIDDGVNYTVELTSTTVSRKSDLATFDRLLATFRFVPRT